MTSQFKLVKEKIKEIQKTLNNIFISREKEIEVILLSLITKNHTVLIGKPGTAKSMLIRTVAKMFNVQYFEYLMTKFTKPEELFGTIDIKLLKETGEIRYITKNKLPEAKIAFLDEIFKASSSILNTLLQILNERKFYNGSELQDVPLWSLFGASNEIPEEEELQALYDRFLFRVFVDPVPKEKWMELVTRFWNDGNQAIKQFEFKIIEEANQMLSKVNVKPVARKMLEIIAEIEDVGIFVSDRRKVWTLKAIAGKSILEGRLKAREEDLTVLLYTIPSTREEVEKVMQILYNKLGKRFEAKLKLKELAAQIDQLTQQAKSTSNVEDLKKILDYILEIKNNLQAYKQIARDTQEYILVHKKLVELKYTLDKKLGI